MAQAILMPKLGQTVEEAAIVKWHRKEGDTVRKGDVLFEIETDKAVLEAESFHDGTLLRILVREQETVPVSSVVAYVGKPGEKVPDKLEPAAAKTGTGAVKPAAGAGMPGRAPASRAVPARAVEPPAPEQPPEPAVPARLMISPRARALALRSAIDPAGIAGTGPGGRIVERDVRAYMTEKGYDRILITPAARRMAAAEEIDLLALRGSGESGRITCRDIDRAIAEKPRRMTRMRQVIAERLTRSFTGTPHFYVTVSADMTELMRFRQELKNRDKPFTVTDFVLKSVIMALMDFPALNSVAAGDSVKWHASVDLGMAVGLEEGLVVPVIRDAGALALTELHDIARDLAERAHSGRLLPDEMKGSTFTVSNMGMMNVENFTAIINPGESGILAVSSATEQVTAFKGRPAVRRLMKMTLSADHRIVDGRTGAAFVNAIKNRLEDMELWKSLT